MPVSQTGRNRHGGRRCGHPPAGEAFESDGEEGGAAAAAISWPDRRTGWSKSPSARSSSNPDTGYNPLVLYGPSGTGKSHLAHGLAAAWKARNRRDRVVCTTAVDFARELADAIESQAVEEFRAKYRTADLLVFEDLGLLATRKSGKLNAKRSSFIRWTPCWPRTDGWW